MDVGNLTPWTHGCRLPPLLSPHVADPFCQVRDGVEDSNAEIRFFNNKVKQKNINHPEGEKQAGRKAEDWSTVKHQTHETHMT